MKASKIFVLLIIFVLSSIFVYKFLINPEKIKKEEVIKNHVKKDSNPVIVAVGDIVCSFHFPSISECQEKETAKLVEKINPVAVLTLGDLQYPSGSHKDFAKYYDKSWGNFKEKTYPTLGNHEYETKAALGYFDYFGKRAGERGKGYYSFDIGEWHLVAINSNCWAVGGCQKDSPQELWLRDDLSKNKTKCILAFWHHPLFSEGSHKNNEFMKDIWETLFQFKADVVLNGHDHLYERFAKQDAKGNKSIEGIREFIVGTGGRSLYNFATNLNNREARDNLSYGVLKMILKKDSYSWEFISTSSTFKDLGEDKCI